MTERQRGRAIDTCADSTTSRRREDFQDIHQFWLGHADNHPLPVQTVTLRLAVMH